MLKKLCPTCGANAIIQLHHLPEEIHKGERILHFIRHNSWFKQHPVGAVVGTVVLATAAVSKMLEKHDYKCDLGHHFKA